MDNVFQERRDERDSALPPPKAGKSSFLPSALLIPLLLLLLLALIIYLFGWISLDRRTPMDLVEEIRASSGDRRALDAFELSRLESYALPSEQRSAFLEKVRDLLQGEAGGDPRVRRALAIVLGRTGNASSVPVLLETAEDADPETQIYALWALGALKDPRAFDTLAAHLGSQDSAVRKTAAFALGELGDVRALQPLQVALQDTVPDVTWNAAVALARLGDESSFDALAPLLAGKTAGPALAPGDLEELRINVIRSLKRLRADKVRTALSSLAESDPSARVRSEARLALEGRSSPPFGPVRDLASPR